MKKISFSIAIGEFKLLNLSSEDYYHLRGQKKSSQIFGSKNLINFEK